MLKYIYTNTNKNTAPSIRTTVLLPTVLLIDSQMRLERHTTEGTKHTKKKNVKTKPMAMNKNNALI